MPTPTEKLEVLKQAYEWEQELIKKWKDDVRNSDARSRSPMIQRFRAAWLTYFDEVGKSNEHIIQGCTTALAAGGAAVDNEIRHINRVEHRKHSVSAVSNAANAHRHQSRYFHSLDALIDLENEVRDDIQEYLTR